MPIALGIDTGGTYTDAVLVDQANGTVLAAAKALTSYHDLSIGIGQAVASVMASTEKADGSRLSPADVDLVALSTTLATNAIVEGRGSPVCLLLIGYDPVLIKQYGFDRELATQDVVFIRGGHDESGDEMAPLDEAAVVEAVTSRRGKVEAFAVSGYFSVRNPAHEQRVAAIIEELTAVDSPATEDAGQSGEIEASMRSVPVTCGHELSSRLNAVRRATTTALNGRLIPLLRELIVTVRATLDQQGIQAPLMVVKGDGSLVRAEWAMRRPIETILAGPAASVVGAWHLSLNGHEGSTDGDVWVVDMGGTTTDIAALRNGRPRLNVQGAQVGHWRTMVEAVDVHTAGLGGDSEVGIESVSSDHEGNGSHAESVRLTVGPRRVVPLSLLASEYPGVVASLRQQVRAAAREGARLAGQFVIAQRKTAPALTADEQTILDELNGHPQPLAGLARQLKYGTLTMYRIQGLEARRLVMRSGFTPTDALHVLGKFERWSTEAACLGAELLGAQAGLTPIEFCELVLAEVARHISTELVAKALNDESGLPDWEREPAAAAMLARALGAVRDSDLECELRLRHPLVAIGAPVAAYFPAVAGQLHTGLAIPPHADVANAVGAVAGGVVQQVRGVIRPLESGSSFRLHLPEEVRDFATPDDAVAYAEKVVPGRIESLAHQAGADQVEVQMIRVDHTAPVASGWGFEVFLETEVTFTAVGRPSLVR